MLVINVKTRTCTFPSVLLIETPAPEIPVEIGARRPVACGHRAGTDMTEISGRPLIFITDAKFEIAAK